MMIRYGTLGYDAVRCLGFVSSLRLEPERFQQETTVVFQPYIRRSAPDGGAHTDRWARAKPASLRDISATYARVISKLPLADFFT